MGGLNGREVRNVLSVPDWGVLERIRGSEAKNVRFASASPSPVGNPPMN